MIDGDGNDGDSSIPVDPQNGHRPCGLKQLAKSMTLCSLERAH